jgi:hypothetical protein
MNFKNFIKQEELYEISEKIKDINKRAEVFKGKSCRVPYGKYKGRWAKIEGTSFDMGNPYFEDEPAYMCSCLHIYSLNSNEIKFMGYEHRCIYDMTNVVEIVDEITVEIINDYKKYEFKDEEIDEDV